jgi:enolase
VRFRAARAGTGPLRLLVRAIGDAGYKKGADAVSIALDPASSEFRQPDERYGWPANCSAAHS